MTDIVISIQGTKTKSWVARDSFNGVTRQIQKNGGMTVWKLIY
jgi:hypothetical protein